MLLIILHAITCHALSHRKVAIFIHHAINDQIAKSTRLFDGEQYISMPHSGDVVQQTSTQHLTGWCTQQKKRTRRRAKRYALPHTFTEYHRLDNYALTLRMTLLLRMQRVHTYLETTLLPSTMLIF